MKQFGHEPIKSAAGFQSADILLCLQHSGDISLEDVPRAADPRAGGLAKASVLHATSEVKSGMVSQIRELYRAYDPLNEE
jgi:hypothetical protein